MDQGVKNSTDVKLETGRRVLVDPWAFFHNLEWDSSPWLKNSPLGLIPEPRDSGGQNPGKSPGFSHHFPPKTEVVLCPHLSVAGGYGCDSDFACDGLGIGKQWGNDEKMLGNIYQDIGRYGKMMGKCHPKTIRCFFFANVPLNQICAKDAKVLVFSEESCSTGPWLGKHGKTILIFTCWSMSFHTWEATKP